MSATESIAVLRGHLAQTREILADIDTYYRDFRERELPGLGRGRTGAIVVAEVFDDTYTALETLFLRVSQFFENRLAPERWHSDLLEKMTLEVPGIRQRLIARQTYQHLAELMRFRQGAADDCPRPRPLRPVSAAADSRLVTRRRPAPNPRSPTSILCSCA